MSNEENKESVIASYELTAAHKEDDDISESEVNDTDHKNCNAYYKPEKILV